MSFYDWDMMKWLYPIGYILTYGKFAYLAPKTTWEKVRNSKVFGWQCELCGAKSRFKETYRHTLIQRVHWHINGRCKGRKELYENA